MRRRLQKRSLRWKKPAWRRRSKRMTARYPQIKALRSGPLTPVRLLRSRLRRLQIKPRSLLAACLHSIPVTGCTLSHSRLLDRSWVLTSERPAVHRICSIPPAQRVKCSTRLTAPSVMIMTSDGFPLRRNTWQKKYRPNLRSRPMEVQLESDWFRPMIEAMTES